MPARFQAADYASPVSDEAVSLAVRVKEQFDLPEIRDWQTRVHDSLLTGKDVMVRAKTGSGKSVAFQGMALSKPNAIVLVVSPLISLMQDQVRILRMKRLTRKVDECTGFKLRSVALTSANVEANPALWKEVDNGNFQIVYASPEMLMDPMKHFQSHTAKGSNKFKDNLILIAIDECHCIWGWERFRPEYRRLGALRHIFINIAFVCLSATIAPHVAAYIHEVLGLQSPTILFSLSIRRDDINIMVAPFQGPDDIEPLLGLVSNSISDLLKMPKTLIFVDGVPMAQRINLSLQRELSGHLQGIPTDVFVRTYWASIDDESKSATLADFKSGRTRIVLATDAFSLGVNIHDIDLIIQWDINEKLTIESLSQRMGRGSRAPGRMSTSIIYVRKSLLESVPQDWKEGWKETDPQPVLDDDDLDELRIIPVFKQRPLAKFGIPVTPETSTMVHKHVRALYKEATSLKDAHRDARQESRGTQQERLSLAQKIDPSVLWIVANTGCPHAVLHIIFREPGDLYTESHQGWCCSFHAKQRGLAADTVVAPGITLAGSISYLQRDPSNNKIILLPKPQAIVPSILNQPRREIISRERKKYLHRALEKWRSLKFKELQLPPNCVPCIVLPDKVIDRIVNNVRNIVTYPQLLATLSDGHWDWKSSLLTEPDIAGVFAMIEGGLTRSFLIEQASKGQHPSY